MHNCQLFFLYLVTREQSLRINNKKIPPPSRGGLGRDGANQAPNYSHPPPGLPFEGGGQEAEE